MEQYHALVPKRYKQNEPLPGLKFREWFISSAFIDPQIIPLLKRCNSRWIPGLVASLCRDKPRSRTSLPYPLFLNTAPAVLTSILHGDGCNEGPPKKGKGLTSFNAGMFDRAAAFGIASG